MNSRKSPLPHPLFENLGNNCCLIFYIVCITLFEHLYLNNKFKGLIHLWSLDTILVFYTIFLVLFSPFCLSLILFTWSLSFILFLKKSFILLSFKQYEFYNCFIVFFIFHHDLIFYLGFKYGDALVKEWVKAPLVPYLLYSTLKGLNLATEVSDQFVFNFVLETITQKRKKCSKQFTTFTR